MYKTLSSIPKAWFIVYFPRRSTYALISTADGELLFWGDGPGYFTYLADPKDPKDRLIVCVYLGVGTLREMQPKLTAARRQIDAHNPIIHLPAGEPGRGFMGPDGQLWAIEGDNHTELAQRLVARLYPGETANAEHVLEKYGWLTLHWGHAAVAPKTDANGELVWDLEPAQLDAIYTILETQPPDNRYVEGLVQLIDMLGYPTTRLVQG